MSGDSVDFLTKLSDSSIFIVEHLPELLKGAIVAIEITVLSILLGMIIGIFVAFFRIYGGKKVNRLMYIYEWIFRGIPILVLLFIIYFGLPSIGLNMPPFISVVLGLGLRSSAYQSQVFRGAMLSIGTEQMEAGISLGMSKIKTLFNVILPQAIRLSLPGFTNEFTIVLKDSPLAYAVGIAEILKNGRDIIVMSFKPFEIYLACAIIYFILFHIFYYMFQKISDRFEVPGFISNK
ncbi:MAG: amino acid ABC transporter permease [Candidatus Delongbacteria bacterium]|nr:amino acid ABC transporter permease [Candidatus Delongbacteria bacterium]MBN2836932.1 amino acid ABC transporter permease [Candidatus Delongbacteria bacterium]